MLKSKEKGGEIRVKEVEKSRLTVSDLENLLSIKQSYANALEKKFAIESDNKKSQCIEEWIGHMRLREKK